MPKHTVYSELRIGRKFRFRGDNTLFVASGTRQYRRYLEVAGPYLPVRDRFAKVIDEGSEAEDCVLVITDADPDTQATVIGPCTNEQAVHAAADYYASHTGAELDADLLEEIEDNGGITFTEPNGEIEEWEENPADRKKLTITALLRYSVPIAKKERVEV